MAMEMLTAEMFFSQWWIIPLIIWSAIWKGFGLWKAGRGNQLYWFLAMFILNTAGILPIVYLIWFQKKRK